MRRWAWLVGICLMAAPAACEVSILWEGKLEVTPEVGLPHARFVATGSLASWRLRGELTLRDGRAHDLLAIARRSYGPLSVEGRAAFSPTPRAALSLSRTWQGVAYPQVVWEVQGPRYAWVRTDLEAGGGRFSLRLAQRTRHPSDTYWIPFHEGYMWDGEREAWIPTARLAEAVKSVPVARGLRVIRVDGRTYTDRFSLALGFDEAGELTLAPAAAAYLDARVGPGWQLDELFLEDARVYVLPLRREEAALRWRGGIGPATLFTELGFTSVQRGIAWSHLEVELTGIPVPPGGMDAEVKLSPDSFVLGLSLGSIGFGPFFDIHAETQFTQSARSSDVAIVPRLWEEERGRLLMHFSGTELWGVSMTWRGAEGVDVESTLALVRPPFPRPRWYRNAGFRLAPDGSVHESLVVSARRTLDRSSWAIAAYAADHSGFPLTRVLIDVEFQLHPDLGLSVGWRSDDGGFSLGWRWDLELPTN